MATNAKVVVGVETKGLDKLERLVSTLTSTDAKLATMSKTMAGVTSQMSSSSSATKKLTAIQKKSAEIVKSFESTVTKAKVQSAKVSKAAADVKIAAGKAETAQLQRRMKFIVNRNATEAKLVRERVAVAASAAKKKVDIEKDASRKLKKTLSEGTAAFKAQQKERKAQMAKVDAANKKVVAGFRAIAKEKKASIKESRREEARAARESIKGANKVAAAKKAAAAKESAAEKLKWRMAMNSMKVEQRLVKQRITDAKRVAAAKKKETAAVVSSTKKQMAALSALSGRLSSVSQSLRTVSRVSLAMAAGLAGVGAIVSKVSKDFESSLTRAATVATGTGSAFESNFRSMSDEAVRLANITEHTSKSVGEGMNFMAMAGFKAVDIIAAMPTVAKLATAANLSMADSANIVTNAITAFGVTSANISKQEKERTGTILTQDEVTKKLAATTKNYANVLMGAFTSSNVSLSELGESLKIVGSVASQLGIPIEDISTAIGLLGNVGVKGTEAGTGLKRALTALVEPSKQSAKAMKAVGLSAQNVSGKGSLRKTIAQLQGVKKSMKDAGKETEFLGTMFKIFGERAGPKMASLVEQGVESFINLEMAIEKAKDQDLASIIEERQLKTLSGSINVLMSNVRTLAKTFGDILLPELKSIAKFLTESTEHIRDMDGRYKDLIITIGKFGFAGSVFASVGSKFASLAADVGIGLIAFKAFGGTLGSITTGLGILGGSVLLPVAAAVLTFGGAFAIAVSQMEDARGEIYDLSGVFEDSFLESLGSAEKGLSQFLAFVGSAFAEILSMSGFDEMADEIIRAIDRIENRANRALSREKGLGMPLSGEGIDPRLAEAGLGKMIEDLNPKIELEVELNVSDSLKELDDLLVAVREAKGETKRGQAKKAFREKYDAVEKMLNAIVEKSAKAGRNTVVSFAGSDMGQTLLRKMKSEFVSRANYEPGSASLGAIGARKAATEVFSTRLSEAAVVVGKEARNLAQGLLRVRRVAVKNRLEELYANEAANKLKEAGAIRTYAASKKYTRAGNNADDLGKKLASLEKNLASLDKQLGAAWRSYVDALKSIVQVTTGSKKRVESLGDRFPDVTAVTDKFEARMGKVVKGFDSAFKAAEKATLIEGKIKAIKDNINALRDNTAALLRKKTDSDSDSQEFPSDPEGDDNAPSIAERLGEFELEATSLAAIESLAEIGAGAGVMPDEMPGSVAKDAALDASKEAFAQLAKELSLNLSEALSKVSFGERGAAAAKATAEANLALDKSIGSLIHRYPKAEKELKAFGEQYKMSAEVVTGSANKLALEWGNIQAPDMDKIIGDGVDGMFGSVHDRLKKTVNFKGLSQGIKESVGSAFKGVAEGLSSQLSSSFGGLFAGIGGVVGGIIGQIGSELLALAASIPPATALTGIWAILAKFGHVIGTVVGTIVGTVFDSIPIIGEAIGKMGKAIVDGAKKIHKTINETLFGQGKKAGKFAGEIVSDKLGEDRLGDALRDMGAATMTLMTIFAVIGAVSIAVYPLLFGALGMLGVEILKLSAVFGPLALATAALGAFFLSFLGKDVQDPDFVSQKGQVKDALSVSTDRIVKALDPLWGAMMPLVGLFDYLMDVMMPLADSFAGAGAMSNVLFQGFKMVAIAIGFMMLAIGAFVTVLLNTMSTVFGSGFASWAGDVMENFGKGLLYGLEILLDGLAAIVGSLGFGDLAGKLEKAADDAGAAATEIVPEFDDLNAEIVAGLQGMMPDMDAMVAAFQDLLNLTEEEARARAEALSDEKKKQDNEFGDQLTNVPSGFKVDLARFKAMDAEGGATAVAGVSRKSIMDIDATDFFGRMEAAVSSGTRSGVRGLMEGVSLNELGDDIRRLGESMDPSGWVDIFGGLGEDLGMSIEGMLGKLMGPEEAFGGMGGPVTGAMGGRQAGSNVTSGNSTMNININELSIADAANPEQLANMIAEKSTRNQMAQAGTPFQSLQSGSAWTNGGNKF